MGIEWALGVALPVTVMAWILTRLCGMLIDGRVAR